MVNHHTPDSETVRELDSYFEAHVVESHRDDIDLHVAVPHMSEKAVRAIAKAVDGVEFVEMVLEGKGVIFNVTDGSLAPQSFVEYLHEEHCKGTLSYTEAANEFDGAFNEGDAVLRKASRRFLSDTAVRRLVEDPNVKMGAVTEHLGDIYVEVEDARQDGQ